LKQLIEFLNKKNILFKEIKELYPKDFGSRKKVTIYEAIDYKSNYWLVFIYDLKSKFLVKNTQELLHLSSKIVQNKGHEYRYKSLFISSPLCTKAKNGFLEQKWKVYNDFM
jgi:hypothetical protein